MAVTLETTTENTILDWLFNGTAASSGNRYLALCSDASYTEFAGGSYARQNLAAAVPAAASGSITSDTTITFTVTAGTTATHWRVFDASSAGNSICKGAFDSAKAAVGTSITIAVGDITFSCTGA